MSKNDSFNCDIPSQTSEHQAVSALRSRRLDEPAENTPVRKRRLPRGIFWRDGVLHIRYSANGKVLRESTKQTSVEFAKQLLAKRKTEQAEDSAFAVRRFARVRFGELLEAWWTTVPGTPHPELGKKTASGFEYLLPRIRSRFAGLRARDMTSDAIREWLMGLTNEHGEPLGPSSKNHHRTIINLAFNTARRSVPPRYDQNPCAGVRQFQEPEGREVLVSTDSIKALLTELEEDPEVYVAVIALIVLNLRKNELLARRWADVQLDGDFPRILVLSTKNKHPKNIPLPAPLVSILQKLPSFGSGGYLFPSHPTARAPKPKRPYRWDIGKEFRAAAKVVGLEGLHVHDLKHVGPSILLAQGVDERIVRKITGHRSGELWRYQHLLPQLRQTTVNVVAAALLEVEK